MISLFSRAISPLKRILRTATAALAQMVVGREPTAPHANGPFVANGRL